MEEKVHIEKSRDFICTCGKSYLSYAALFTHIKQKHNGKAPGPIVRPRSERKRGRPRKTPAPGENPLNHQQIESSWESHDGNSIPNEIIINNIFEADRKTKEAAKMLGCGQFMAFQTYRPAGFGLAENFSPRKDNRLICYSPQADIVIQKKEQSNHLQQLGQIHRGPATSPVYFSGKNVLANGGQTELSRTAGQEFPQEAQQINMQKQFQEQKQKELEFEDLHYTLEQQLNKAKLKQSQKYQKISDSSDMQGSQSSFSREKSEFESQHGNNYEGVDDQESQNEQGDMPKNDPIQGQIVICQR